MKTRGIMEDEAVYYLVKESVHEYYLHEDYLPR